MIKQGSVYRFDDRVALHLHGETRYLNCEEANKLRAALRVVLDSIEVEPFTKSRVGTINFSHGDLHD